MGLNSDAAINKGDLTRRVTDLEHDVQELQTTRRLPASSINSGQVRVIREDGPGVLVEGGGSIDVNDGGSIKARYVDGTAGVLFGSLIEVETGEDSGHGLLVQDDDSGNREDIFRAKRDEGGTRQVFIGQTSGGGATAVQPIENFRSWSNFIGLHAFINPEGLFGNIQIEAENQINLRSSADPPQVRMDHAETASAANAFLDMNSGRIQRSTSSARYKKDIRSYEPDLDAYRRIEPKRFYNARQFDDEPASKREIIGFIAEDIDSLGLVEVVTYDGEGRPDGIDTPALLAGAYGLIKAQQAQIDALTARVEALESA